MRPEKLLQCIECGGNSFSLRYFYILIPFVHSRSSSLPLEVLRKSVKVLKYLLNQHLSYPSSITFSNCNLPPFPSRGPPLQYLSVCFLLLGHIYFTKYDLRPSIQIWDLVPTIAPQNFNFSLVSEDKKQSFDILKIPRVISVKILQFERVGT